MLNDKNDTLTFSEIELKHKVSILESRVKILQIIPNGPDASITQDYDNEVENQNIPAEEINTNYRDNNNEYRMATDATNDEENYGEYPTIPPYGNEINLGHRNESSQSNEIEVITIHDTQEQEDQSFSGSKLSSDYQCHINEQLEEKTLVDETDETTIGGHDIDDNNLPDILEDVMEPTYNELVFKV